MSDRVKRHIADSSGDPVLVVHEDILYRLRLWSDEQWRGLDDRPEKAAHIPGLGWVVALPIRPLNGLPPSDRSAARRRAERRHGDRRARDLELYRPDDPRRGERRRGDRRSEGDAVPPSREAARAGLPEAPRGRRPGPAGDGPSPHA